MTHTDTELPPKSKRARDGRQSSLRKRGLRRPRHVLIALVENKYHFGHRA